MSIRTFSVLLDETIEMFDEDERSDEVTAERAQWDRCCVVNDSVDIGRDPPHATCYRSSTREPLSSTTLFIDQSTPPPGGAVRRSTVPHLLPAAARTYPLT